MIQIDEEHPGVKQTVFVFFFLEQTVYRWLEVANKPHSEKLRIQLTISCSLLASRKQWYEWCCAHMYSLFHIVGWLRGSCVCISLDWVPPCFVTATRPIRLDRLLLRMDCKRLWTLTNRMRWLSPFPFLDLGKNSQEWSVRIPQLFIRSIYHIGL